MQELVVLVDEADREIGTAPKLDAHRTGALHRAVSVFLTAGHRDILLQQRAAGKYHSPGRWSNTCCGHPRAGEDPRAAGSRRLLEEMGIVCNLEPAGKFHYRADLGHGLTEHEIDHVFVGRWHARPHPDPVEVGAWRWISVADLEADLAANPDTYTAWVSQALEVARQHELLR
ncbi:MAG: isopentenyl-diphosphate Delta-isomerase [Gemmatimonadaceae bacterium]|nr:isopentenyl-diphosphate Delta-isomerase [Gemmatimonadaceae bacterium]